MKRSIINIFVAPEGCINVDIHRPFELIRVQKLWNVRRAIRVASKGHKLVSLTFIRPFDIVIN